MYVKTFRYRVLPGQLQRFREVQRRVAELVEQQLGQDAIYLQSTRDLHQWLEIHIYADEQAWQRISDRMNAMPEIEKLWREFRLTLDPGFPSTIESFHQHQWLTPPPAGDDAEQDVPGEPA